MLRFAGRCGGVAFLFLTLVGLSPHRLAAAPPESTWLLSAKPLVVLQADQPTLLVKSLLRYAALPELSRFPAYREFLDSTGRRRFLQLLAHLEKELGCSAEELLDRLAGRGLLLSIEPHLKDLFGKPETKATLWLRGRDAEFTQKAVEKLVELATQELARAESKDKYEHETFQGVRITKLGDKVAFAVLGADVVLGDKLVGVKAAISRSKQNGAPPEALAKAKAKLAGQPLAWLWADLAQAKKYGGDNFKKFTELPTNEFFVHVIFGGWIDVVRRSDEIAVALNAEGEDLLLNLTMPAGTDGMSEVMKSVFAAPAGQPGTEPLLPVPGALFQTSFVFHPHGFIEHLQGFVTPNVQKEFAEFDKKSRPVLLGRKFSDLVGLIGARHQFVAARQRETGYQTQPRDRYPSFAGVLELKDAAKFDQQAVPLIRAAGLLTSFNVAMKLSEEKVGEHTLLTYRFVENEKNKERNHGFLFNFSPTVVRVGDRLIASSTQELAKDLLPLVTKEGSARATPTDAASSRYRFSWAGLAYYLEGLKGQVLARIILTDGSTFEEAEQQMADLKKLLHRLGTAEAAVTYGKDEFKVEVRTRFNPEQANAKR